MTIDEAIGAAIDKCKAGDILSADIIYSRILDQCPGHKIAAYLHEQVRGAAEACKNGNLPQRLVLNAFEITPSPYLAMPAYNAAWAIRDFAPIHDLLSQTPFTILDIGARDAFLGEIENLKRYCDYFGFDADAEECRRLNANPPQGFHRFTLLPHYIGTEGKTVSFHLYRNSGESSQFSPSRRFQRLFNEDLAIARSVQLTARSLDSVTAAEHLSTIDFLKLDTQGSELEILRSGASTLDRTLLLETEIEITECYEGQPLLGEVVSHLHQQGFELLYLNRVFRTRQNYPGPARGQIIYCDALFAKHEDRYPAFTARELARHAVLLCNYGHLDIAYDIWRTHPTVQELLPNLPRYFSTAPKPSDSAAIMNQEKLLYWQLVRRGTNQLPMDSDRSWPFR